MSNADFQDWWHHAEGDYRTGRTLAETRDFEPRIACFVAQQAVEKYLKAVLVRHGIPFGKTHDLEFIAGLLPPGAEGGTCNMNDLRWLTQFAVEQRYPVPTGVAVTLQDVARALDIAYAIRTKVANLPEPTP